jgi:septal ring factor EnvC (AmiA/AmiB activator)
MKRISGYFLAGALFASIISFSFLSYDFSLEIKEKDNYIKFLNKEIDVKDELINKKETENKKLKTKIKELLTNENESEQDITN